MYIRDELKEGCDEAAYDIKNQIPEMPHPAFDVVTEYVEEEHVADDVEPPAVKEHRGQEGIHTVGNIRIGRS
jgi:hypothetical protein